jgi:hypothetical protein
MLARRLRLQEQGPLAFSGSIKSFIAWDGDKATRRSANP